MKFGPFLNGEQSVFSYADCKKEAQDSGLIIEPGKNFFDKVLDFNWHK
jgi:hypothetical protein